MFGFPLGFPQRKSVWVSSWFPFRTTEEVVPTPKRDAQRLLDPRVYFFWLSLISVFAALLGVSIARLGPPDACKVFTVCCLCVGSVDC